MGEVEELTAHSLLGLYDAHGMPREGVDGFFKRVAVRNGIRDYLVRDGRIAEIKLIDIR